MKAIPPFLVDGLLIISLWLVSLCIVNPIGDFPLNDDWSYGLTVKRLINDGDFHPLGWTGAPLLSNVLWGALFCIPAGFSFTALRLSTLAISLAGVFGIYFLLRELRQPRWLAVVAALTVCFNPVYYALSNTFMTDVFYTAVSAIAVHFFVRNLKDGMDADWVAGTVLVVVATLSRQLAVSIPMAFAVSLLLKNGIAGRNVLRAAVPLLFSVGSLVVFGKWLEASGRMPTQYNVKSEMLVKALATPQKLPITLIANTYIGLQYLGLFLMPVLVFQSVGLLRTRRNQTLAIFIVSLAILCGLYVKLASSFGHYLAMPILGNIMIKSGIGALTLRDEYVLHLGHVPELPSGFWAGVTAVSLSGAVLLTTTVGVGVANMIPKLKLGKLAGNEAVSVFLLSSMLIYFLPISLAGFFDRYLIPEMPLTIACIASFLSCHSSSSEAKPIGVRFVAVAFLAALGLFAVCGTRDYLEWNRLRWQALHGLLDGQSVEAEQIDGGLEFSGLYFYDLTSPKLDSLWWVRDGTYLIGFGEVPGFAIVKEYRYNNWMPPGDGKIVVQKREDKTEQSPKM